MEEGRMSHMSDKRRVVELEAMKSLARFASKIGSEGFRITDLRARDTGESVGLDDTTRMFRYPGFDLVVTCEPRRPEEAA
jgi:hypothetical protein